MFKKIVHSENETLELSSLFASKLNKNDVVVLTGDLGTGKTKFTEGILKYFSIEKEISSPTFTIVNEYNTDNFDIFHFDVYRLDNPEEFLSIGGDEYFSLGACIIEWGEKIKEFLPRDFLEIIFEKDASDSNSRIITFIPHGKKYENLVKEAFSL